MSSGKTQIKKQDVSMDSSAFAYGKEKTCGTFIAGMVFSHFGLLIIVGFYVCFGAWAFVEIERPNELAKYSLKQDKAKEVEAAVNYTAGLLWYYGGLNVSYSNFSQQVYKDLKTLEAFILDAVDHANYDGTIDGWRDKWFFMNSVLLTMSIVTTIGYGHIIPETVSGQLFCILYALVGAPLFLLFLAKLGDSMASGFVYIYSRWFCRCCRSRRYLSEVPENASTKCRKLVSDDVVGNEEYMPTKLLFVPITINVVVLHMYMALGAIIFNSMENWDLTAAYYFTFITIATIGYGDYIPGNSLADSKESMTAIVKLLITVLFIIIGMALLSMCINLMQEQIVRKCKWMAREIGLTKDDSVQNAKPIDPRRDSLMPLVEENKGSSPFRKDGGKGVTGPAKKNIPGIIEE